MPAVRLRRDHARVDRRDPGSDLRAGGGRGRARGAAGRRPPRGRVDARRRSRCWTGCWRRAAGRLTVEVVHGLLGTASDERLLDLLEALADHDAAAASRGCSTRRPARGCSRPTCSAACSISSATRWCWPPGPTSILARRDAPAEAPAPDARRALAARLDPGRACRSSPSAGARLRGSLHGRLLVELALVRIARLEDLEALDTLVERLTAIEAGAPPPRRPDAVAAKKKREPAELSGPPRAALPLTDGGGREPSEGPAMPPPPRAVREEARAPSSPAPRAAAPAALLDLEAVRRIWSEVVGRMKSQWRLQLVHPAAVVGDDVVVIAPRPGYNGEDDPGLPDAL